ncbi:hypothetical protein TI39_contig498g00013 [Zymoseptoria brevis]|uniref:Uncharacterized protein n=1 Tax=Zymoseptoria brevis TaxID=1047168 RepID=A0A0F4GJD4_9PEZI|nr:hypothetical protein TI39_contig498g00013 [Zymoseptoria brevis]
MATVSEFGCKKCPCCGNGVKKMFGCPHVQCHCGTHLCPPPVQTANTLSPLLPPTPFPSISPELQRQRNVQYARDFPPFDPNFALPSRGAATGSSIAPSASPINIDGGSEHQREASGLNLGPEAEHDGQTQVWACDHQWTSFEHVDDRHDHGDVRYVECNRCSKSCPDGRDASMCDECGLLVCDDCKADYQAARNHVQ